jgi:transposase
VAQGSGLTRGDRNRNRKLAGLRDVVRRDCAVLAIDLGEDKQAAVVMDHECRVLARKTVRAKAHHLDALLAWGTERAGKNGFAGVTVACEPTGHRWKALMGLADSAGQAFVCVQSMAVHRSRETDDYTMGKTDHRDAYLIGKLVTRLECYLPERAGETRARLRHLGARRAALVADVTAVRLQAAGLLGCAWPAALGAAARPAESLTWRAAMAAVTARCAGRPERLRKIGYDRFLAAVRRELPRWGGKAIRYRIVKALWEALADRGGVLAQRPGAIERLGLLLDDWRELRRAVEETEKRMLAVLDELGLTGLASSIDGVTACPRRRSWQSPATRAASAPAAPWSSTPGSTRPGTPRPRSAGRPGHRGGAGPACGPPPGVPCGARCAATRSCGRGTPA